MILFVLFTVGAMAIRGLARYGRMELLNIIPLIRGELLRWDQDDL